MDKTEVLADKIFGLEEILDSTPSFTWSADRQGNCNYASKSYLTFIGAELKDAVGSGWLNFVDERDRERVINEYLRMVKETGHFDLEYRLLEAPSKTPRWFISRARPIFGGNGELLGFSGSCTDINEQRRIKEDLAKRLRELSRINSEAETTKARLAQSEALFRTVCEASPQIIWTTDDQGNADFFNKQWFLYTGSSTKDCRQLGWMGFMAPEDIEKFKNIWSRSLKEQEGYESEVRLRRYDGKFRWHLVRCLPMRGDNGKIIKWCGTATDIEGHRRLVDELIAARDKAQEADRLKTEFVSNMSHEIRTPMNGILGMVEILLKTDLSSTAREYILLLKDAGQSLLGIINNVLDFAKIEAGKLELSQCDMDLGSLVEGVAELLSPQADAKNLLVTTHIDPRLPDMVLSDPLRLRQVLLNLAGNAVKFTERGSVTIKVEMCTNETEEPGATIQFSVIDTGIGIARESLGSLFQAFVQVDGSISRRYGGTGLGLSISKRLIELLGGSLEVESEPGEGSTFRFSLPCASSNKAINKSTYKHKEGLAIIIDSDAAFAECLKSYCIDFGMEAIVVTALQEALAIVKGATVKQEEVYILIDAVRSRETTMKLWQVLFNSGLPPNLRMILISTKDRKQESERLLPLAGSNCSILVRPIRRAALRKNLKIEKNHSLSVSGAHARQAMGTTPLPMLPDNLKVLVADDNKLNQHVAKLLLASMGLSVDLAEDGLVAVNLFSQNHYDMIFLDCQMPELDGYSTARRMREIEGAHCGHTPIIAMTANALTSCRDECLAAGMDDYLAKPIESDALEKMVCFWGKNSKRTTVPKTPKEEEVVVMPDLEKQEQNQTIEPVELIDYQTLLARFTRKNAGSLLSMFAQSAGDDLQNLSELLRESKFKELKFAAHSLKGACLTICAPALSENCRLLEEASLESDGEKCRILIDSLKAGLEAVCTDINKNFSAA